jgi:quercetin dioxygenase-like cupin family protein
MRIHKRGGPEQLDPPPLEFHSIVRASSAPHPPHHRAIQSIAASGDIHSGVQLASSAFIYAYVTSGRIRSAVDDQPARVYGVGEGWFEKPGAHHLVSENASETQPAQLLAVFIVDANDTQLTMPDRG